MQLSEIDQRLLNEFQRDLTLDSRPYLRIAETLGVTEQDVLDRLERLHQCGAVSRVGAVVRPNRIGASTLAALAVPPASLDEVAAIVNGFAEVNHNYEREHRYNLWFVVTAQDRASVDAVLAEIESRTGLIPLDLPMLNDYHIDLGFSLQWT